MLCVQVCVRSVPPCCDAANGRRDTLCPPLSVPLHGAKSKLHYTMLLYEVDHKSLRHTVSMTVAD